MFPKGKILSYNIKYSKILKRVILLIIKLPVKEIKLGMLNYYILHLPGQVNERAWRRILLVFSNTPMRLLR